MIPQGLGAVDAGARLPPVVSTYSSRQRGLTDDNGEGELSATMRADLLDFDAWGEVLKMYGRTMRVAVALTDSEGLLLGKCHNPQPVWNLVHDAASDWGTGCPFCITKGLPCTGVADAVRTGAVVVVHDQAGLTHVAVPLTLGEQTLGAIIAGQVFDRYPEPLLLRRVANNFGISAQDLWAVAKKERPVAGALLQASGDLLGALGHAFLQQRHAAILEEKLAETNDRFRWLADGIRDYALFTMDTIGRVTSWNVGAERMLGYTQAEIMGRSFSYIFPPEEDVTHRVAETQLSKALQTGRAEYEGWSIRRTQEHFWANVNITALPGYGGPIQGFAIIMQDTTERKKIALVLEEAQQERARLQEKFLSHVSHELRTPLTAIYFFTTNVLDGVFGDLTPEQHKHLAFALDNVTQLKDMVSDLLDITRVETHKLTLAHQPTRLVKVTSEVLSTCRTNAAAKNISLRADLAANLPLVWADPARVRQILTNLIDNGIKFTPDRGTISVKAKIFGEVHDFVCVSVSDSGCGISAENREIIFDRLAQVKGSGEVSRSGLGLGLFISRELVTRHGGRMWLDSRPGHGSTFYFTLPVFSLAKYCSHIFSRPNLDAGSVTLITVDVVEVKGGIQEDILREIRQILERCIHAGQDVLLPATGDEGSPVTFFIVACTDPKGSALIASRILRDLQNFDKASQLNPAISSMTMLVARGQSREEQIREVAARIESSVQEHLLGKERNK
jgi:PAS domain S-box-containing protein